MEVKIEKNVLLVSIPISEHTSKSGKSLVIASTNGNVTTGLLHNGKPVVIGLNAYTAK